MPVGAFRVAVYHGASKNTVMEAAGRGQYEIVITTPATLQMNFDDLTRIPFHVAIYDEAHKLKSCNTQAYATAYDLPTKFR